MERDYCGDQGVNGRSLCNGLWAGLRICSGLTRPSCDGTWSFFNSFICIRVFVGKCRACAPRLVHIQQTTCESIVTDIIWPWRGTVRQTILNSKSFQHDVLFGRHFIRVSIYKYLPRGGRLISLRKNRKFLSENGFSWVT
jgi:hypothetical protein